MSMKSIFHWRIVPLAALALTFALFNAAKAQPVEIKVVTSGGFTAAWMELAPEYERAAHIKLVTEFGPSMGTTHNAIPRRLERGEVIDVVILASQSLGALIQKGKVRGRQPRRPGPVSHRDGCKGRSAEARHQHRRRPEAHLAGRKIDCLFR
jgi:ABC-type molybdate transport system substrate-binding protein